MDISAIRAAGLLSSATPALSRSEAATRRDLIQAAKSVNASGMLGQNELVFIMDRATHRPIIRVENRETGEVLLQLPPEYVLRLAEDLRQGTMQTNHPTADV